MRFSRRRFLTLAPLGCATALAEKYKSIHSLFFRYSDYSTENEVLRITDPACTSRMPPHYSRALPRRGNFLLYASDMGGRMDAYRMESRSGISHQLTEEPGLDPASLVLMPDERSFCCVVGGRLIESHLGNGKVREIYRLPAGFESAGLGMAEDGVYAALIEHNGMRYRLRLIHMQDGSAVTLAEANEQMREPIPRPRRASVLYGRANGLWLADYTGKQNYRLRLADGMAGAATWSPEGRTVLYLNYPSSPHKLHNIREFTPDSNQDVSVADTSQYAGFERNADASVFVGASGSKASPHVLLLVREVKRELTLCEHRASDASMVNPVFSPNSQDVFFTSDQHGKPAIYTIPVSKFVADTDKEDKSEYK